MDVNNSLPPEEAIAATTMSPTEQAVDQGNESDAGQGPASGTDKAEGAALMTLGPEDGPAKTEEEKGIISAAQQL